MPSCGCSRGSLTLSSALRCAGELGIAHAIHPALGLDDEPLARRALALLPADGRRDLLALALATRHVPPPELAYLLHTLAFEASDRQTIIAAATRSPTLARDLGRAVQPSEIAGAVADAGPELVALAGALGPEREAREWLANLRHVRLEIGGNDLIAAGVPEGPAIGIGLRAALAAKLDGRVVRPRSGAPRGPASGAGQRIACQAMRNANALRWQGQAGHYEVYYLTATDPRTGVGIWIRYTMLAPLQDVGEPATCSLWFSAMDPDDQRHDRWRKATFAIDRMRAPSDPFELRIGDALLTDERHGGRVRGRRLGPAWTPAQRAYEHVHPALARLGVAKTVLVLPHADLLGRRIGDDRGRAPGAVGDARSGQAHLWGSKHAALLGVGPLQRPSRRSTASASPARSSTACR